MYHTVTFEKEKWACVTNIIYIYRSRRSCEDLQHQIFGCDHRHQCNRGRTPQSLRKVSKRHRSMLPPADSVSVASTYQKSWRSPLAFNTTSVSQHLDAPWILRFRYGIFNKHNWKSEVFLPLYVRQNSYNFGQLSSLQILTFAETLWTVYLISAHFCKHFLPNMFRENLTWGPRSYEFEQIGPSRQKHCQRTTWQIQ